MLFLLVAAVISGLIGEWLDTLVILFIVLLNGIVGAVQAYRADRAVAALKALGHDREPGSQRWPVMQVEPDGVGGWRYCQH